MKNIFIKWFMTINAFLIKISNGKCAAFDIVHHNAGYQITADDEKNINTHISARKQTEPHMEKDHGDDGQCSDSVNFSPVVHCLPMLK